VFSKHKDWPWVWQPDLRQEIRVMTNWAELLDQGSPQGGETGLLSGGAHLLQASDGAGCGPRDPILAREVLHCDDAFVIRAVLSKAECRQLIIAAEGQGFGPTTYPKLYRGNQRLTTKDVGLADVV
jgi:hypothetical protein